MIKKTYAIAIFLISLFVLSCRQDVELHLGEETLLDEYAGLQSEYKGFYLLNEGNMGMNKSTLDYFDLETGIYKRNIYAEINPNVPKELGDVGNDLKIYAGRLYAVVNASNKVEVMDAKTAKRIAQIEIPNCRHIAFDGNYAYVTSYAGPIEINPNYTQKGYVAKIDLITLQEVDRCIVGYQPEELAIANGKIYVANSGGYMGAGILEDYENTVSVIDIESFEEQKRIVVDYNLQRIRVDKRNNLWVSTRGDYVGNSSRLFYIDKDTETVIDTLSIAVKNLWMDGDSLYVLGSDFSFETFRNEITYKIVDTQKRTIVNDEFITDETIDEIEMPYGVMVNPINKDVYLTDAGDYITPGVLYCFDKTGKKKWSVMTGDIPAHFALLK